MASLLTLLDRAGEAPPPSVGAAARLTRFAVVTRYPGVTEPVTAEEHQQAVATAEAVLTWATELIRGGEPCQDA